MRDGHLRDKHPRIAGFEEPKNAAISEVRCSRVRVRKARTSTSIPKRSLTRCGDGSHIGMVTSGTDAEDGMDYQGGGSSVRGLERQGSQTLSLRTPGPSIAASPPRITSMV